MDSTCLVCIDSAELQLALPAEARNRFLRQRRAKFSAQHSIRLPAESYKDGQQIFGTGL
jgi:hypothetical protein